MGTHVVWIVVTAIFSTLSDCSLRDITDLSVPEDGVVQILLPEEICKFQMDVLTIDDELNSQSKTFYVGECTTIVVIGELRGQGILIRVPRKHGDTEEVIYRPILKRSRTEKSRNADKCRRDVDEGVELHTPFIHQRDHAHPAKLYISETNHWPSRAQFCNDEKIQPTSCSDVDCSISQCVRVIIPDPTFLLTAYHEETCNTHSDNNTICETIHSHFNGTEWYRHDVARQCVVVADTEQCFPSCNSLYNATESSTVFCNFTSSQCHLSANPTLSGLVPPSKPTRPSLYEHSLHSLTLSFTVKFGSARIDCYLLRIINVTATNGSNTTDLGYTLINITSGDLRYLTQEKEIVEGKGEEEEKEVVGYEVRLKVGNLEQGEEYVFTVAASSTIGVGDFSDLSDPYSLSDIPTHHDDSGIEIIASVAAAVLIVLVLTLVAGLVIVLAIKKCRNRRDGE